MRPPQVMCIINSLAGGGAERIFASLVEMFRSRAPHLAFEVVVLDREPAAYALPAVPVTQLDAQGGIRRSVTALAQQALMRQPDLLFSFLTRANCAAVIAGKLCGRPVVISERTFTSAHLRGRGVLKAMVRALYPGADRVIAVGQASRADLIERFGVRDDRVSVIHNPVAAAAIRKQAAAAAPAARRPYVVAMGRLTPSKNFALLIEAFAAARLDSDLLILGDGPEREALQNQIEALGLGARVRLLGRLQNPFPVLSGALCLAVSSNVEGFPNVIVEALALGVPVVSTDCECGPAELLGGDAVEKVRDLTWAPYGALTPPNNAAALAAALSQMCTPERHDHYSKVGPARAAAFDPERAADMYLAVLEGALSARGRSPSPLESLS